MARSSGPRRAVARPHRGHTVPDDACRAFGGASRQRSNQQSADEPPRALSALSPDPRSVAPFGAAMDHLSAPAGHWRSVPRSISAIGRRALIATPSRVFRNGVIIKGARSRRACICRAETRHGFGDKVIRTVGQLRVAAKIVANLTYDMRRLVWMETSASTI